MMTFRWRLCLQLSPLPPPPRWCSHQRMVKTQRLSSPLDPIGGHHKQKYFHMSYISSIQYFRTWVHRYLRRVFKGSPPVSLSPSAGSTFFRQKYFFTIWILFAHMHLHLHFAIKKHLGEVAAITKLGMAEDDFPNFHLHCMWLTVKLNLICIFKIWFWPLVMPFLSPPKGVSDGHGLH